MACCKKSGESCKKPLEQDAVPMPITELDKLQVGALAYCSDGYLGLITKEPSGPEAPWIGIHLTWRNGKFPGSRWQSMAPTIVSNIANIDNFLKLQLTLRNLV